MKSTDHSRREFLRTLTYGAAGIGIGVAFPAARYGSIRGSNNRLQVGVMGTNSRGHALARGFARLEDAEVTYICDVDRRAIEKTVDTVQEIQTLAPKGVRDFREMLDDQSLDALIIATPDHWHAPAALQGIQAGKHIYVEKPCCHTPHEGEMLVRAAREQNRVVQMGNQRRSWPFVIEAMQRLQDGAIGEVYYSRGWYASSRGSIGHGEQVPVPEWLDYDLWQGPAPRVPYQDNIIHYNWHWFWRWGTGEAGNNGTHAIDLCRWGLQAEYPTKVTSAGGRYRFDDDWETPDTQTISMEFGDGKALTWEGLSCNPSGIDGGFGASFHGAKGTLRLLDSGYTIYDLENQVVTEVSARGEDVDRAGPGFDRDAVHFTDFLDAIRNGTRPNSDIEGGYKSTLLVLLGNIAQRTGQALECNPENGHIRNAPDARDLWTREYELGWEPMI